MVRVLLECMVNRTEDIVNRTAMASRIMGTAKMTVTVNKTWVVTQAATSKQNTMSIDNLLGATKLDLASMAQYFKLKIINISLHENGASLLQKYFNL